MDDEEPETEACRERPVSADVLPQASECSESARHFIESEKNNVRPRPPPCPSQSAAATSGSRPVHDVKQGQTNHKDKTQVTTILLPAGGG